MPLFHLLGNILNEVPLSRGGTLATKAKVNGPFIRGWKYDPVSLFALIVKRQGLFQVISIV